MQLDVNALAQRYGVPIRGDFDGDGVPDVTSTPAAAPGGQVVPIKPAPGPTSTPAAAPAQEAAA
jgi:hypothetical protein